ncbi:MAG: hypothetical protein V4549_03240 [Bacteroidota bacterium]
MNPWQTIGQSLPIDGSTVWIRMINYYAEPYTAVYNAGAQSMTLTMTAVTIPLYMIARWKNV